MDHNLCLERGLVHSFVSHNGITHYVCPCVQPVYAPPVYYPQPMYAQPVYYPQPVYSPIPTINPNYRFPSDGIPPTDMFEPFNLCNPGSNVALYNIHFQINSTTSDLSTQEECEIECDISPSRDELSSSSSSACEMSQCDLESESENKKKRNRKRKNKRKIQTETVKEIVKAKEVVETKEVVEDIVEVKEVVEAKEVAEVKVTPRPRPIKKKKKKSCDDEELLEQLVKENLKAKKEYEIKAALTDICQSSNKILGIIQILLTRSDTRCYTENLVFQIQYFLGMEEDKVVRLGSPLIKETIDTRTMAVNLKFLKLSLSSFDNFYTCVQLSDLANDKALDICSGYLTKCIHLCDTIYNHIVTLMEVGVDISIFSSIIEDINRKYNWKEEAIKFLGTKLTDVYKIFPTTEWPVRDKLNSLKDVNILKDCTWGPLSNKDRCDKCGATNGTVIYSSCCYTRQVFCKCDCDLENSTVPCQNLSSECIGDVMHIKDLLLSQPFNKDVNVQLRETLLEQDRTIVPRIVGKFNSEEIL